VIDFLMYAEDPGAANYVGPLSVELRAQGHAVRLLAEGAAVGVLTSAAVEWEPVAAPRDIDGVLDAMQPRVVVAGTSENPDSAGLRLLDAARTRGCISVGAVDAYSNAEYRFRGRASAPLAHAPEYLMVPDRQTSDAFVRLGYPAECIRVCGHPRFEAIQRERRRLEGAGRPAMRSQLFPDAAAERHVLVFVAEVSTGMNPRDYRRSDTYTLHGWGAADGRTEIVLEEFLDAVGTRSPRPYLVLRLHPKNTRDEFVPYLKYIDRVSEGGSPLDMIFAADGVVGMTSMLLMEAALLGQATLSIVPREMEKSWLPAIGTGLAACATTADEILRWLEGLSARPPGAGHAPANPLPAEYRSGAGPFLKSLIGDC
jgi:hypothetical protein